MKLNGKTIFVASVTLCLAYLGMELTSGQVPWSLTIETATARPSRGLLGDSSSRSAAQKHLEELALLNRSVIHIKENYVDPTRVNERKMVAAALESIQEEIDEVLVRFSPSDPKVAPDMVTVKVGGSHEQFNLKDVTNLWTLCFKLKDIFRFIAGELKTIQKPEEVEYAAINGLLSTLDPHSVLLRPAEYREMKLSTDGNFGGLGIVIQVKNDALTVVRIIQDTPAEAVGLRAGDVLHQIGLDSTVNMSLDDAVTLLRGKEGTRAEIWVRRKGWKSPRRFLIRRAWIKVKSVHARLLKKRVGVVRIDHFQHTTHEELQKALRRLKKGARGRLNGLILDLRSNPGGLLTQAVRVADAFITSGPLVTTVGYGDKMREPRMATRAGTESALPLAVLINPASASASEIVAGAIKNHNRGVVIGQRSFGKGSVQVLYSNRDDSALKLTIAQYLTPGDISIQSVGITPDIETQGVLVTQDKVDLISRVHAGEQGLPSHLSRASESTSKATRAQYTIKYLRDLKQEAEIAQSPNDLHEDFEMTFARNFLSQAKTNDREHLLRNSSAFVTQAAQKAWSTVQQALADRKIDWSGKQSSDPQPLASRVTIDTNLVDDQIQAGETLKVTLTVHNDSPTDLEQVYAITDCEDAQFHDHEFIFGRIPAGEKRSWSHSFPVDASALARENAIHFAFKSRDGRAPKVTPLIFRVTPVPAPKFTFTYALDDTKEGNGDGLLQVGETAELIARARNIGVGDSRGFLGILRNDAMADTRALFIKLGRVNQGAVPKNGEKSVRFKFAAKEGSAGVAKLLLTTYDPKLRWGTTKSVELKIVDARFRLEPKPLFLRAQGDSVPVYAQPTDKTVILGSLSGVVTGRAGINGWYRVRFRGDQFGWVRSSNVQVTEPGDGAIKPVQLASRLKIELKRGGIPLSVTGSDHTIVGVAYGQDAMKDVRIYANDRKIYYGAASAPQARERLRFTASLKLQEEITRVTVIARSESDDIQRQIYVVRRADAR